MPFDLISEGPVSLSAACREMPAIDGRRPCPSTLWRWCRIGIDGIRLEYARIGRRIVTSHAALARFATALAAADKPIGELKSPSPIPLARNAVKRQRDIAAAEKTLTAGGI